MTEFAKNTIVYVMQKLLRCGCCKAISDSLSRRNYLMSDVGIPEIWHFIYKSRSTSQLTSPDYSAPYTLAEEQARLFAFYQWVHNRMHSPARALKILFLVGKYESILGWVSTSMSEACTQIHAHTHTHTPFNGHSPGKPGLDGSEFLHA